MPSSEGDGNQQVKAWVDECVRLCKPLSVHWCDGSEQEFQQLCRQMQDKGTLTALNPTKRPGSFLARSHPADVARVEDRTFIASAAKDDAGPTNNWASPSDLRNKRRELFAGCMSGRTMYVVPFCMGPLGSPYARIAVQITDSPYVVVNMNIMTRMGKAVLERLGDGPFIACLHSVGAPIAPGQVDSAWPCNPENKYIVHNTDSLQPGDPHIWSYGSGYGGNALLGKKCLALRIASSLARREGWLAEHMLIVGLTPPGGKTFYVAAAFPSACGKTNLAMLQPSLPGWTVRCVGDDIAWLHVGSDGRLRAINPEAGFFGVAPGTSLKSNPQAMATINRNTIFTNVGLTADGDVWWEKMTDKPPEKLTDWTGQPWTPQSGKPAAHPNARYTAHAGQCPIIDPAWEDPEGVPISAILFGGRRAGIVPLICESLSWEHGVFLGSIVSSETTAAAGGEVGKVRHDPFAMLPFCGYNMGDYFTHWFDIGARMPPSKRPRIFYVNWFRKDSRGNYLWPGFGENIRVLKWVGEHIAGGEAADLTPIGYVPKPQAIDRSGLTVSDAAMNELLAVDVPGWLREVDDIRGFYRTFGDHLPPRLAQELSNLQQRLLRNQSRANTGGV